jgi:hypothetical protein
MPAPVTRFVLGIAPYKKMNFAWLTFGVRNSHQNDIQSISTYNRNELLFDRLSP